MIELRTIRNKVVHAHGIFKDDKYRFKVAGVSVNHKDELIIESEYIKTMQSNLLNIFQYIDTNIPKDIAIVDPAKVEDFLGQADPFKAEYDAVLKKVTIVRNPMKDPDVTRVFSVPDGAEVRIV